MISNKNGRRKAVSMRRMVTHTQKKAGPDAKTDMLPSPHPNSHNNSIDLRTYA